MWLYNQYTSLLDSTNIKLEGDRALSYFKYLKSKKANL